MNTETIINKLLSNNNAYIALKEIKNIFEKEKVYKK